MPDAKLNKGIGYLTERPDPAKLPNSEMKLKKSWSSEGSDQQQKADADVLEGDAQVPCPAGRRPKLIQLGDSGFRVMDKREALWNFSPQLRKVAESGLCQGWPSMPGGP